MESDQVKFDQDHAQVLLEESKERLGHIVSEMKKSLQELKSLSKPPQMIANMGCAIAVLFGSNNVSWRGFQAIIGNPAAFESSLSTVSIEQVDQAAMARVQEFVSPPEFNTNELRAKLSSAEPLGIWLVSFIRYWRDYQQIHRFVQQANLVEA